MNEIKETESGGINQIMSASIVHIAEALAKAQGEMQGAKKESTNPFYNYDYADLASCYKACSKALSENGLSVVQTFQPTPRDCVKLITLLVHESGEYFRGEMFVWPEKTAIRNDDKEVVERLVLPQDMGSAITYGRRYMLCAMVGIYQEDDDANKGSKSRNPANKPNQNESPSTSSDVISEKQRKRFYALTQKESWTEEAVKAYLSKNGYQSSKDIKKKDYEKMCEGLNGGPVGDVPPEDEPGIPTDVGF